MRTICHAPNSAKKRVHIRIYNARDTQETLQKLYNARSE